GGLSPVGKDLMDDVLPMIEKSFKVSKKPEDRGIAGLSMGGGQTLNVALNRPEMFKYVAIMSGAVTAKADQVYPKFFGDAATANKQFKLFWVGVGKDDMLTGPGDRALEEMLTMRGITHTTRLRE